MMKTWDQSNLSKRTSIPVVAAARWEWRLNYAEKHYRSAEVLNQIPLMYTGHAAAYIP